MAAFYLTEIVERWLILEFFDQLAIAVFDGIRSLKPTIANFPSEIHAKSSLVRYFSIFSKRGEPSIVKVKVELRMSN